MKRYAAFAIILALASSAEAQKKSQPDVSPHKVQLVTVDRDVTLEVLDWGGTGRPLVFLAGLGDTAHTFDRLALEFTKSHHVYGITRRGFGNSSKPEPTPKNYSAARLGQDVVEVIDSLRLERPILAGHSLAGEELSWVGSHAAKKVSGLIYLDAGYSYAFYAPGNSIPLGTNLLLSGADLSNELNKFQSPEIMGNGRSIGTLAKAMNGPLSNFQKDLSSTEHALELFPPPPPPTKPPPKTLEDKISEAIMIGPQKFTQIRVPILALFGDPPAGPPHVDPKVVAGETARWDEQVNAFAAGLPAARVVKLANAQHELWVTNRADVVREMNAFMNKLK